MSVNFTPSDWYYQVRSDAANAYSTARGMFVPLGDANCQDWLNHPDHALAMTETKQDIGAAIAPYKVTTPTDAEVLAGFQEGRKKIAPQMVAAAHAIIQGTNVTLAGSPFNVASASRPSVGVFNFAFITPQPSTDYTAMITCTGGLAELGDVAGKSVSGFTINVFNAGGQPHDPRAIDVQIFNK